MLEASMPADEPFTPPDTGAEMGDLSMAVQHARHIEGLLALPRHYIAHVDTSPDDLLCRALVHVHQPDTRYMLDCPRRDFAVGCILLTPYVREEVDAEGRRKSENVTMTLFARRHSVIEPVALVHLPEGDQMGHGLFIFPELPDV